MANGFGKKQKRCKLKRRDYLDFLHQSLGTIRDNKADVARKIIEDNLDKLDQNFLSIFRDWATETLPQLEADKADERALNIADFSKIIQEIPENNPVKKAIYIEITIAGYEVALLSLIQDSYSEIRANIQYDLGNAYCDRIRGDDWVINRKKAIEAFESASEFYNRKDFQPRWADIQNNLATAYSDLVVIDEANIEKAKLCCENALEIYILENCQEDVARAMNNLGSIHRNRKEEDKQDNLESSISYYNSALEIYKRDEVYLEDWARIQDSLGNTYVDLSKEKGTNYLEQAFYHYSQALEVYKLEDFPEDWARVQNNLGMFYFEQGDIKQAIACFRLSLKVCTPTTLPTDCLDYGGNFGDVCFASQYWKEAIEGYNFAVQSVEQIRSWSRSETRRQQILHGTIDIYENIVEASINIGQLDQAFEYSERFRSQRLVELMASSHISQGENIPPKVQDLLQKYEELQQQIDIERQNYKSENKRSETRAIWKADNNEKIKSLEIAKQEIWEQLRKEDPILAGEIQVKPLSLSEVQQLIDHPKTAILSFYTTDSDTHIFIITQKSIYLHTCIGEGLETLQHWIWQNWLLPYKEYVEKKSKNWEIQLETILHELSERLQLSELIGQHLQGIEELIIEPHLLLHQIPFAALPTGEYQEYLVDRFLIRYTPSCQILDFCHQNHKKKRLNLDVQYFQYGTVEDATDDLYCAKWEGEQIAQMYNIPSEKRLIGSSQATVQNYRKLAEQVQILHSCHHAESCLYNPLESQLKLGDGSITLGQLMSPGWRLPNLLDVFLSCCETNLDKPDITDNLLTLSTGFLCAGAISVISSLWKVNDLATALFSIFYYQQRQEGKNRPEALKQAQIKLRELKKADLEEISQAVENQRKQARNQKKQYPEDSKEYLECDFQHKKSLKILNTINYIQKSTAEFPFAHPRYWSAFIAQGLQ
ncbi:MAG: CHAT domain-containing protein [Dolichospermum sp.]|nr:CHAT domain-containing protein [Dolichospermum sp.]